MKLCKLHVSLHDLLPEHEIKKQLKIFNSTHARRVVTVVSMVISWMIIQYHSCRYLQILTLRHKCYHSCTCTLSISESLIFPVSTSSELNCCRCCAARQNCRNIRNSHTTAMLPSRISVRRATSALPTRHICRNIYAFTLDWNPMFARHVCNKHFYNILSYGSCNSVILLITYTEIALIRKSDLQIMCVISVLAICWSIGR